MNALKSNLCLMLFAILVCWPLAAVSASPIPQTTQELKKEAVESDDPSKKSDSKKLADEKPDAENQNKGEKQESAKDKNSDEKKSDEKKSDSPSKDDDKKSRNRRPRERNQYSKQSQEFIAILKPVVASANDSTVRILAGKRQVALGTVVDADGLILTKASELRGVVRCKLANGDVFDAKVKGIDPGTDLALLEIPVDGLSVVQWSDAPAPQTGRWVAAPKANKKDSDQPTIGIVSVDQREIPPSHPFIGINMAPSDGGGIRIDRVISRSPADIADLWINDVILSIDKSEVNAIEDVRNVLGQYDPGDRVTLLIRRGETKRKIKLTLAERDKISPNNQRSNQQNRMGSILSRRRKDFPVAFQHDSPLSSSTCGGPVVDLSGLVVGVNIARAGRVSSLALPVDLVLEKVALMKTGKLAPEIVNKLKIEEIDIELEEIAAKLTELPEKKQELDRKYNIEKARSDELKKTHEELEKQIKTIQKQLEDQLKQIQGQLESVQGQLDDLSKNTESRLKVADQKSNTFNLKLRSVRKEIQNAEKTRQRLEADRRQLMTGSR